MFFLGVDRLFLFGVLVASLVASLVLALVGVDRLFLLETPVLVLVGVDRLFLLETLLETPVAFLLETLVGAHELGLVDAFLSPCCALRVWGQ